MLMYQKSPQKKLGTSSLLSEKTVKHEMLVDYDWYAKLNPLWILNEPVVWAPNQKPNKVNKFRWPCLDPILSN